MNTLTRKIKARGVALLTSLFFGVMCMSLATGFLLQVPVDLIRLPGGR